MAPPKPTIYKDALIDLATGMKKPTSPPAKVDLDKSCGVNINGSLCPKPLRDCQTHSRAQKRAVLGRTASYDMLIIPSWSQGSHASASAVNNEEGSSKGVKPEKTFDKSDESGRFVAKPEKQFDNGEGSSKGGPKSEKNTAKKTKEEEKIPKKKAETSSTTRKRKAEDEDSDEDGSKQAARPKGKKRGPKAWTALEAEIAKDIREYAGHTFPMVEHLEVARKIIEKVLAPKHSGTDELPGGTYRVSGWS